MTLSYRQSPNHGPRPAGSVIDMLVIHYTGMVSAEAALARLCDPAAEVSAHYLIDSDGSIWQLVDETRRAWHAGVAYWAGLRDVNSHSIGIELANPGHDGGYPAFPAAQMHALVGLAQGILARHPIPARRIVGHADIAPRRKIDPGEKFDWAFLAQHGIGLWPDPNKPAAAIAPGPGLAAIGYEITADAADPAVIAAFQRHFRPTRIDGQIDAETAERIAQLVATL